MDLEPGGTTAETVEGEVGEAASKLVRAGLVGAAVLARQQAQRRADQDRRIAAEATEQARQLERQRRAEDRVDRVGQGLSIGAALQPDPSPAGPATHVYDAEAEAQPARWLTRTGARPEPTAGAEWDHEAAQLAELTARHFPKTVGSDLAHAMRHPARPAQPALTPQPPEAVVELS